MSKSEQFDYIFAGFGLSGMSLFYELSKDSDFVNKKVLVIDQDQKQRNDRTWSFWSKDGIDYLHLAKKSWQKGVFFTPNQKRIDLELNEFGYHTIEAQDFYQFHLKLLTKFHNVKIVFETIQQIHDNGTVLTENSVYLGDLVFRSHFNKADFHPKLAKYFIWQHFYGYVIETEQDCFNPDEFTLMDYRFTHQKRTNFFYALPYSSNCALVEFTEFSNHQYSLEEYQAILEDYIVNQLKIRKYKIVDREFNAIPMTNFQISTFQSQNVLNIGSLAGYLKPSSGYAFTRTIERNKKIAQCISQLQPLEKLDLDSSKTYKAFDNAILYLIQNEKVHGGLIFSSLFDRLSADFVFNFLDEKASSSELLRIMRASPNKIEFIKYFILHQGR